MDQPWIDSVFQELGKRYRPRPSGSAVEIEYRSGKAEFHPTRILLGGGASGREIAIPIDLRIPRGTEKSTSEAHLRALEEKTMTPRGFTRQGDDFADMTNQRGEAAGFVRSLRYGRDGAEPAEAARHVRAILESLDLPIVMGVHDPSDLAAKDPMPPPPRPAAKSKEPLEPLRFRLATGLLHDLSVIIDQNERTMTIMERSFVSTRQVGETIKLAHVGKLATRRTAGGVELVAIRRDGTEFKLAQGKGAEFIATAARLAKGVRIPYAES